MSETIAAKPDTKTIRLRDHFKATYQAASALVLNGKITPQNLEKIRNDYDKEVVKYAEILLNEK